MKLTVKEFDRLYRRIEGSYEFIAGWDPIDILREFRGDYDHWRNAAGYLKKALDQLDKIKEFNYEIR